MSKHTYEVTHEAVLKLFHNCLSVREQHNIAKNFNTTLENIKSIPARDIERAMMLYLRGGI